MRVMCLSRAKPPRRAARARAVATMDAALRALRAAPILISDEPSVEALCAQRPPFGLLDSGSSALVGLSNSSKLSACNALASRMMQSGAGRRQRSVRHRSCAVVGSGGIMRSSGLGKSIDRHAAVIRFNGAPTFSLYVPDVGSRTTLQLSTLVPWRHWRRRADAAQLDRVRDSVLYCHNHWVGNCWSDALKYGKGNVVNPVLVAAAGALLRAHGSRKASRVPSSGLVGIAMALASCDGVPDVYGFGNRSGDGESICDHYWECRTDQGSYLGRSTHSFIAQWRVLTWLNDQGAIRLHSMAPANAFRLPPGRPRSNV